MQAVTGCDGSWPFFHFWHHNLWPKLASPILDFCGRKRPFQWYPDKSDRPNGVWDKHKNAKKVECKTQSKLSCHYTWLLRGTNCLSPRFLRGFLTVSKPSRRSITAAKRKGEKGKAKKKNLKIKSLKMYRSLSRPKTQSQNLDFYTCLSYNVVKPNATGKKGKLLCCKCLFD